MIEEQSIPVNCSMFKSVNANPNSFSNANETSWRRKLTQLLVILAVITVQLGNLDNKCRRDGGFRFLTESDFPAWINRSSDLLTKGLSQGSLVTLDVHVDNHSSPRDEKRMKGPEIPIVDNIIGVRSKPTTLPR